MPSLKLSNPFRRNADRTTLKQRAADLKASLGHSAPAPKASPASADPSADAELLALGYQFDAARMTEIAACEDCNAAQREADRHMPERPACLFYRASDERLNVFRHLVDPESLNGVEINSADVERLRRIMPMTHEILRPIRYGERAHIDHPGRKFDIVAHPEAQARAVEIVTAWDAWRSEQMRVQSEHFPEALDDAANEAGNEAAALAARIAALPALTADGFRVKLRAFSHYQRKMLLAEIPEEPDPDQLLSHSLWRDAQGMLPAPPPANVLTAGILELWREWAAKEEAEVYDEALQQRRFGLIGAAEALPATMENVGVKALALAWLEYVDHWRPKSGRGSYTTDGRLAIDIHTAASQTPAAVQTAPSTAQHEPNLVGMLNLASASLEELRTVRDIADCIGSVAYAHAWGPRCRDQTHVSRAPVFNAAGKLVQWVGDALTAVETAAEEEAKRRTTNFRDDDEIHLSMLAETTIDNGDPDEIEAFAGKLLAHAKAEREGR